MPPNERKSSRHDSEENLREDVQSTSFRGRKSMVEVPYVEFRIPFSTLLQNLCSLGLIRIAGYGTNFISQAQRRPESSVKTRSSSKSCTADD